MQDFKDSVALLLAKLPMKKNKFVHLSSCPLLKK